jgi:hypothetical protein
VWSSPDGLTWQQATPHAGWSQRVSAAGGVFNNQLWFTAGADPLNFANYNDVWSSPDGQHWSRNTPLAPFVVLNNQLCIVAGNDGGRAHDMWCSPDGVQWRVAVTATMQY